jgi:hypothetical protein
MNNSHRIYSVSVASVYPHCVAKAQENGRTKAELSLLAGASRRPNDETP